MFVLESALGQQLQVGFLRTWRAISSRLVGLGVSSCILSVISSTYMNVLVAWSLFYLGSCFTYPLPYTVGGVDHADSARKYWTEAVLQKGHDMTDFHRGMNWSLLGAHLVAWSLTSVLLCTGFLGQKRALLVTGVVPAILLSLLLARAVTLPGATDGLLLFLKPSWGSVFSLSAWTTAASQMFFGLGIGWGALINFASFNPMRNNFYKDAAFVVSINAFAAMLSGTIFFAIVGYMAHASGLEVDKVARAGTGSPFLVFSVGVGQMPLSTLFALCFWSMMAFLGLVSQYQTMEVVMTALVEIDLLRSLR
ncbi:MAG: hypothetical protein KVP17_000368 [Porospora cf. gigantea B]|nr:MAG: hypothetical protein KVP17_000368 [Porospora cf. gigantea B]